MWKLRSSCQGNCGVEMRAPNRRKFVGFKLRGSKLHGNYISWTSLPAESSACERHEDAKANLHDKNLRKINENFWWISSESLGWQIVGHVVHETSGFPSNKIALLATIVIEGQSHRSFFCYCKDHSKINSSTQQLNCVANYACNIRFH